MRLLGDVEAPKLIETVLSEIEDRYPENLSRDDCSLVVLRVNERKPHYSLKEKLQALLRFSGTLIRSVDPKSERAPFPDLNVPNVGGAIVPQLARQWRGIDSMPIIQNPPKTPQ
jgi:hypothetical protein